MNLTTLSDYSNEYSLWSALINDLCILYNILKATELRMKTMIIIFNSIPQVHSYFEYFSIHKLSLEWNVIGKLTNINQRKNLLSLKFKQILCKTSFLQQQSVFICTSSFWYWYFSMNTLFLFCFLQETFNVFFSSFVWFLCFLISAKILFRKGFFNY